MMPHLVDAFSIFQQTVIVSVAIVGHFVGCYRRLVSVLIDDRCRRAFIKGHGRAVVSKVVTRFLLLGLVLLLGWQVVWEMLLLMIY